MLLVTYALSALLTFLWCGTLSSSFCSATSVPFATILLVTTCHMAQTRAFAIETVCRRNNKISFIRKDAQKPSVTAMYSLNCGNDGDTSKPMESPSAERNKAPIWNVLSTNVFSKLPSPKTSKRPWKILEIAAGSGVHTEFFASQLLSQNLVSDSNSQSGDESNDPFFSWQPTDPGEDSLASIQSRIRRNPSLKNVVASPKSLTLVESGISELECSVTSPLQASDDSGVVILDDDTKLDAILCINMIHISPWEATVGLMKTAGKYLREPNDNGSVHNGRSTQSKSDLEGGGYLYCYGPYRQEGKIIPSNESFDKSLKSRNQEWGVRSLNDVVHAAREEGLELVDCVEMPANNLSLIFCRPRDISSFGSDKE